MRAFMLEQINHWRYDDQVHAHSPNFQPHVELSPF
jgi:hypothetical protein